MKILWAILWCWVLSPAIVSGAESGTAPIPSPSAVLKPLTEAERAGLRSAFIRSLATEVKALSQRHRAELADLRASQKARRQELKQARRDFFKSHPEPAKRREYLKDHVARLKALDQLISAEWKGRKGDQQAAQRSLKEDQRRRLAEFDGALKQGHRPSDLLWTSPGM